MRARGTRARGLRRFIAGTAGVALPALMSFSGLRAQFGISDFVSVPPQNQVQPGALILPLSHTFQILVRPGDSLNSGGYVPDNFDFTGYVPVAGSSVEGLLSLNHELSPGGVTVHRIHLDYSRGGWKIDDSRLMDFLPVVALDRPCSGTVTPWGTVISCEESGAAGDSNGDGYADFGWCVEFDPFTMTIIDHDQDGDPDKIWKAGKGPHENAAVDQTGSVLYTGLDHPYNGYLLKFIPDVPGDFSLGSLFALMLTGTDSGQWVQISNGTPVQCSLTASYCQMAGANNFNGIEDVEIGPDGRIYFSSKGHGVVYVFQDDGATVSGFGVHVGGMNYTIDYGSGQQSIFWDYGNDNLAFDNEGNLWVLQDGGYNHIWVVRAGHTQANPKVELFGRTPSGSEPTGITFSPDNKYLFISLQHPGWWNVSLQLDCFGRKVSFNDDAALVISRDEYLGTGLTQSVFRRFNAALVPVSHDVSLEWDIAVPSAGERFEIERGQNGSFFELVHSFESVKTGSQYGYLDVDPPPGYWYYRIKRIRLGYVEYSPVRAVIVPSPDPLGMTIYPVPVNREMNVDIFANQAETGTLSIIDITGKVLYEEDISVPEGILTTFHLDAEPLPPGCYVLILQTLSEKKVSKVFLKD